MKILTRTLVLAALAAALAFAQPHQKDIVHVTLPYPVIVGDKTLQPGDYTIEQMPDAGDTPILMISNGNGLRVQSMAMTVRSVDTKPPEKCRVDLHRLGNNYYLNQVWVEGNPYGYTLVLPAAVKGREKEMESISLPAR
jgi:hypothetical protein